MYDKYITKPINPETGFSGFFDREAYTSEIQYRRIRPKVAPKNKVLGQLDKEVLTLKAYGISHAQVIDILGAYKKELLDLNKEAVKSYITRLCVYYGYHLKELKRIIGADFIAYAEQLIDYSLKEQDRVNNRGLDAPIVIATAVQDIRLLMNKLLNYTSVNLPEYKEIKDLNKEIKDIKQLIMDCDDTQILNEHYAKLLSLMSQKDEYKKHQKDAYSLKAISCLKSCGFTEAAYKWLNSFPLK